MTAARPQPADRLEPVRPEMGQLAGTVDGAAPDLAAIRCRQATQIAEIERAVEEELARLDQHRWQHKAPPVKPRQ